MKTCSYFFVRFQKEYFQLAKFRTRSNFLPFHFAFSYHSFYDQVAPVCGFINDLWREIALAHEQEAGRQHGPIKIAALRLNHYRPEEVSVDVDSENITLHGQHRTEDENGFESSEFKKVIKLPQGVDPTSVTSRFSRDGGAMLLQGIKRVKRKATCDRHHTQYATQLGLIGFKPEEIKIQRRGQELTITGIRRSEEGGFLRNYSRRFKIPDDADLNSVKSHLSKEGLLTIQVSRDPAFLQSERSIDIATEIDEPQPEDEAGQARSKNDGEEDDY